MIILPIGSDCGVAELLKKYNIRTMSHPFDWMVTYTGISKIIKDDFVGFIPENGKGPFNPIYDMWMTHYEFPNDTEKMERRIQRFRELLQGTEELVFLRKGHWQSHHAECNRYQTNQVVNMDDIVESENLDTILHEKYPQLKYTIIVLLICGDCYNPEKTYLAKTPNVIIHNIAMTVGANEPIEQKCVEIFSHYQLI